MTPTRVHGRADLWYVRPLGGNRCAINRIVATTGLRCCSIGKGAVDGGKTSVNCNWYFQLNSLNRGYSSQRRPLLSRANKTGPVSVSAIPVTRPKPWRRFIVSRCVSQRTNKRPGEDSCETNWHVWWTEEARFTFVLVGGWGQGKHVQTQLFSGALIPVDRHWSRVSWFIKERTTICHSARAATWSLTSRIFFEWKIHGQGEVIWMEFRFLPGPFPRIYRSNYLKYQVQKYIVILTDQRL